MSGTTTLQKVKSTCSDTAEYVSIQSSNSNTATVTSSPIFTENSSSNHITSTSTENILSHTTVSTTNTSISQNSIANNTCINGKPIVYNTTTTTVNAIDQNLDKDLFYCIDRTPASPPDYHSINLIKSIRFPIYESTIPVSKAESPPPYTPAINKITMVSLKLERLSPYEPSNSRCWKDYIVEINSTQLNFYSINESLSAEIKTFKSTHPNSNNIQSSSSSHSPKAKKTNGFFSSLMSKDTQSYELDKIDHEKVCSRIIRNESKYINPSNLCKSYTLQYAKFGIPIDYDKKPFVLRLRCESEQFLMSFNHIDDMIHWAMYLSIGISVSLDLEFRQLPDYRVVPRRRRRRRRRGGRRRHRSNKHKHRNNIVTGHRSNAPIPTSQTKSRSYSLSSMRSGLNPSNFRRSSAIPHQHNHSTTTQPPPPRNLTDIEQILSLPTDHTANSVNPPATVARTDRSRSNSSASLNLSFKAKMKSLFKSNKSFSTDKFSSETTTAFRFGSPRSNSSLSSNGQSYSRNRSMSIPVMPSSSTCLTSKRSTSANDSKTRQQQSKTSERTITQNVINEIQEHHSSQGREDVSDGEEEEEEEDTVYNSTDDHLTDDGDTDYDDHFNTTTESNLSIYAEEGLLHDDDDDDDSEEDDDDETPLSSNTTMESSMIGDRLNNIGSVEYASYESDDIKWAPDKKELTRRRYIRDSIRCIKPLVEDQEWINHVVFRPTREPKFKTNNPPIWMGDNDGKARFKYISSSDFSNVKNHYLRAYVVGPIGFLKADTKVTNTPIDLIL